MARFFDPATAPGELHQNEWNEGNPYTLANAFGFAEPGEITALWWYLAAPADRQIARDITARVFDPAGNVLGEGSLPYPATGTGWAEVPLRQPVKVRPDAVYLAAVSVPVDDRGNVHYAARRGLGRDGGAAGPITVWTTAELASLGIAPGNGRFAPGADAFPGQSFDDVGYGVDVTFRPGPPQPRTLHVRQDGDDGGDGSAAAPWRTLARAVATLAPADTLLVGDGTWAEAVTIAASGLPGAPVVVRAENRHAAFVDIAAYAAIIVTGHHVEIDGLRIRNPDRHGIEGQRNHHMTVRNCLVEGCGGNGIGAFGGDFYTIEDNVCRGNGRTGWNSGISVYHPDHRITGDETTAERNVFRRNLCTDNHMLAFLEFTAGTGALAAGDTVTVGATTARADRVELRSGSWADGTAAGRIGLLDIVGPVRALRAGETAVAAAGRVLLAGEPYTDVGLFTDGNGIILDDWLWAQDPAAGYAYPFGALVEDNVCARNGGKGLQCYGVQGLCLVRNNTVWHNNRDAMQVGSMTWRGDLSAQDTAATFVNNIAVADPSRDPDVTAIGIYGGGRESTLVTNLTFDGTPGDRSLRAEQASWTGSGNLFGVDPRFVDAAAGDFRLAADSPARGAGTAGAGGPPLDLGARAPGG